MYTKFPACYNFTDTSKTRRASSSDGERTQTYVTRGKRSATQYCEVYARESMSVDNCKRGERGGQLLYPLPVEGDVYYRAAVFYRHNGAVAELGVANLHADGILSARGGFFGADAPEPAEAAERLCRAGITCGAAFKIFIPRIEPAGIFPVLGTGSLLRA